MTNEEIERQATRKVQRVRIVHEAAKEIRGVLDTAREQWEQVADEDDAFDEDDVLQLVTEEP